MLLHLYGGSASEETPLARPAPGGGWVLPLPLRRKVRQPERACLMLQEWYRVFGSRPRDAVPLPEAEARELRRQAAWERRGLAALRLILTGLSVRLWLLWFFLYLFACIGVEKLLALPPLAILGICFPPFLLSYFWLRRRIRQGSPPCRRASRLGSGGNPSSEGPFPAVFCGKALGKTGRKWYTKLLSQFCAQGEPPRAGERLRYV